MDIKVTVQFRNDQQGIKNLDAAYKTIASILLNRIQAEKANRKIIFYKQDNKHKDQIPKIGK